MENIDIETKANKLFSEKQYEEKRVFGTMTWKTYLNYFRLGVGIFGTVFIFFVFVISEFLIVFMDYWVSQW